MLGGAVLFGVVRARLIGAVVAGALAVPATAAANGDPASDILLQLKVYFPNQKVAVPQARALNRTVNEANAKGYTIRVALIRDATDLGTVPNLLGQPQKYAAFLGPEIRFVYRGDLLVVMADGLGLVSTGPRPPPSNAIEGIQVAGAGSSDGLAQTATEAVTRLAAAAGHPLASSKKGGGSSGTVIAVVVAVLLLAAGVGGALWARRQAPRGESAAP
jgi:hypothetical protein